MKSIIAHFNDVTAAHSVEELWEFHTSHMAAFGFDRLIYGYTRYNTAHSLGDPQDWVLLTNHGDSYINTFLSDGHLFHAPMVRWALENSGACSWRWLEELTRKDGLSASELRVVDFNRRMNVTAGYTISLNRSLSDQKPRLRSQPKRVSVRTWLSKSGSVTVMKLSWPIT